MQRHHLTLVLLTVGGALMLSGCGPESKRMWQHADSPFHFVAALAGYEHEDIAPIRKSGGRVVRIESAHAVRAGEQMRVYGTLKPVLFVSPVPDAHVDVHLVDANGKTLAHAAATYSQTFLQHRMRGGGESGTGFSARLPLPPPGAHVEIVHHDETVKKCMTGGCVRIAAEKQS